MNNADCTARTFEDDTPGLARLLLPGPITRLDQHHHRLGTLLPPPLRSLNGMMVTRTILQTPTDPRTGRVDVVAVLDMAIRINRELDGVLSMSSSSARDSQ